MDGMMQTGSTLKHTMTAWLAVALLTGTPAGAQGGAAALMEATDLAADARQAAALGVPLVLLYSRDDCSWCEKLRREYLAPLARDPAAPALVRELHMDRATPLIDFGGRRTTSADFSKQMQAQFAPTVMFHGPQGASLAEPIVGFRLADFYGAYLDRAIEESRAQLRREKKAANRT
jgi:hypothetical protein